MIQEFDKLTDHPQGMNLFYNFALETSKKIEEEIPFIEIGIRLGGSSLYLLKAIKDSGKSRRPLITVDPYGEIPYEDNDIYKTRKVYGENYFRQAMKTLFDYSFNNNLLHINFKLTSHDFIKIFSQVEVWNCNRKIPEIFGFVYLDGAHVEQIVAEELEYFRPRLSTNGILVIDDFSQICKSQIEIVKNTLNKGKQDYMNRMYYFSRKNNETS